MHNLMKFKQAFHEMCCEKTMDKQTDKQNGYEFIVSQNYGTVHNSYSQPVLQDSSCCAVRFNPIKGKSWGHVDSL